MVWKLGCGIGSAWPFRGWQPGLLCWEGSDLPPPALSLHPAPSSKSIFV